MLIVCLLYVNSMFINKEFLEKMKKCKMVEKRRKTGFFVKNCTFFCIYVKLLVILRTFLTISQLNNIFCLEDSCESERHKHL